MQEGDWDMMVNLTLPQTIELPDWWIWGIGIIGGLIILGEFYRIFYPNGEI
jgi:hypothetical protein